MKNSLTLIEFQRIKHSLSVGIFEQIAKERGLQLKQVQDYFHPKSDKKGYVLLDDLSLLLRGIELLKEANAHYEQSKQLKGDDNLSQSDTKRESDDNIFL